MNQILNERSSGVCELCKSDESVSVYQVPPAGYPNDEIVVCRPCLDQIEKREPMNSSYWHFLSDAMWNETPAVQVVAWRMLSRMKSETWAADNLDMMYLEESAKQWAEASDDHEESTAVIFHRDVNGNILVNGDTVVLTKSLDVKGSSINARMGTVVKNIKVVEANTDQIEGKIDGQVIVILTKYLRKQIN